jgi:hypothetical protein
MNPPVSKDIDNFVCPHCQADGISPLSASFVPNLAPVVPEIASNPISEQTLHSVLPPESKVKRPPKALEPRFATSSTRSSPRISEQEVDHLRCTSYHNRVVVRTGEDYHESESLWGKVTYMGKQSLPCALNVSFENGRVEGITSNQVSAILCEEGIEMPNHNVAFPAVAAKTLQMLPPTWTLDTTDKLCTALRSLMPNGGFRKTEITSNSSRMPGSPGNNELIRI